MQTEVTLPPKPHIVNSSKLTDPFGRKLDYLRLSITERCNLRCTYCMPAEGVPLKSSDYLLSFEEMNRLVAIFSDLGITKIRITGGEPFVRRDAFSFMTSLKNHPKIVSLNITTNAVLISDYISRLKQMKIDSLNISLDTLDRENFFKITLRDEFLAVYNNLMKSIEMGLPVKINMVVMKGVNEKEIIPFARLTENMPVEVRFIEQMPFNGGLFDNNIFNARQIEKLLAESFTLQKIETDPTSTSKKFQIPNFKGRIGIIAGFSRTFCGSCNRLRLTADGMLKTCLYDRVAANLKKEIRTGKSDEDIRKTILMAVSKRAQDGHQAQKRANEKHNLSMAQIGG